MVYKIDRVSHLIRRLRLDWFLRKIIPLIEQIDKTSIQPDSSKSMCFIFDLPQTAFESLKQYDEKLTASYDDKGLLFWLIGHKIDAPYEEWELSISWGNSNHRAYEIDLDFGSICGKDMQKVKQVNRAGVNELITAIKTAEYEKKPTKS